MGDGDLVDALGLGLRIGGDADRRALAAGHRGDLLPEFFGDERDQRVREAQDGFQRADQRAARGALLRFAAGLDLHLGDLQVPVAELVPDEFVDGLGDVVETVVLEAPGDFRLHLLQGGDDPAVGLAELQVAAVAVGLGVVREAAVVAFAVHQHEAAGVPELVAEIAVALAALAVEVDAAAQAGERGEGEAQRVGTVGGNTFGEFLLRVLAHLGRGLGAAQAGGALFQQGLERDAVDQVHRIEHVALGLGHLLALGVAHETVHVNVFERHAAREVRAHHDHPGDPEEDDVVARDQHGGGQVEVVVFRRGSVVQRFGPAERREGHERGGIPGVQHVGIARELRARAGLGLGVGLAAGHVDLAGLVVPRRDLVAPPELAADAPVLDVVHPLVVGVDPVLGHELHLAGGHGIDGLLGDRLARRVALAHLAHGDEPLVRQHGLDHLARAGADGDHEFVLPGLDQGTGGLQVGHDGLAGHEAVHAAVFLGGVLVDGGLQGQHHDHGQAVALAHLVVVGVVRGRDLDDAGAEFPVDVGVGDDGDLAAYQGQGDGLADQRRVALVLGVDHHGHVAQHGLGPRGGHREAAGTIRERVGDVPERAVLLFAFHFQVGHGGLQHRVPVHEALAAVDQALLIKAHEGVGDDLRELVVHGEVFAAPVHAVAQAAHLRGDGVAALFLPFPDLAGEGLAAQVVAAHALFLQLALHHDLRGDAGVVGARHPQRVVAPHAVVARQAVHDGLVERMAHVQRAGHVGRRQLDGEVLAAGRGAGIRCAGAAAARRAVAPALPLGAPAGFQGRGFEGLGQAFKAGLVQGRAHGRGNGQVRRLCKEALSRGKWAERGILRARLRGARRGRCLVLLRTGGGPRRAGCE